MAQTRLFHIHAMTLPVAEHLFDPHTPLVGPQRGILVRQVGGQKPNRGMIWCSDTVFCEALTFSCTAGG